MSERCEVNRGDIMTDKKKKTFDEWEIRNALDDLERAEKVKANPELMKFVEKEAKKKISFLGKIKWTN